MTPAQDNAASAPAWLSARALVGVAVFLAVAEMAFVGLAPLGWLVERCTSDDYFYYLTLARHVAAGEGATFDGDFPTNGFHPLWLLLLSGLARIAASPEALCRAGLGVLVVFHNAIGVALGLGVARLKASRPAGAVAAALWFFNPWALSLTLLGLEVPLSSLCWVLLFFQVLSHRSRQTGRFQSAAVMGVLAGFAILSRTDSLLLFGSIGLFELIRVLRTPQGRLRGLAELCVYTACAVALTLPWWLWNVSTFGTIQQGSSQALFLLRRGFEWTHPASFAAVSGWGLLTFLVHLAIFSLVPAAVGLDALWRNRRARAPGALWEGVRQLDFAVLCVLLCVLWYGAWQGNTQQWYLLASVAYVTLFATLSWLAAEGVSAEAMVRAALGKAAFAGGLIAVLAFSTGRFGYPAEAGRGAYQLAGWLERNTPPGAVIGSWNAGMLGFFSRRKVVNLDGVVNNHLLQYARASRVHPTNIPGLAGYLCSRKVGYVADYEPIFAFGPERMEAAGYRLATRSAQPLYEVHRLTCPQPPVGASR